MDIVLVFLYDFRLCRQFCLFHSSYIRLLNDCFLLQDCILNMKWSSHIVADVA